MRTADIATAIFDAALDVQDKKSVKSSVRVSGLSNQIRRLEWIL